MHKKIVYTIGIDEVGRGPLAGPVCVCALALSRQNEKKLKKEAQKTKLADSKKLTEHQRKAWAAWRRKYNIPYAVVCISPAVIDKIRIHNAIHKAAQRAYEKIWVKCKRDKAQTIADAGIRIIAPNFKSFPKADELIPAVSFASIMAKLHRDRYMLRAHTLYPRYDFITNKGYGTQAHLRALKKHGPSKIHRLTFIGGYYKMKRLMVVRCRDLHEYGYKKTYSKYKI